MTVSLYDYCIAVLYQVQAQGKPEWALSSKEKRALRHLKAINQNFVVQEIPPEQ